MFENFHVYYILLKNKVKEMLILSTESKFKFHTLNELFYYLSTKKTTFALQN